MQIRTAALLRHEEATASFLLERLPFDKFLPVLDGMRRIK